MSHQSMHLAALVALAAAACASAPSPGNTSGSASSSGAAGNAGAASGSGAGGTLSGGSGGAGGVNPSTAGASSAGAATAGTGGSAGAGSGGNAAAGTSAGGGNGGGGATSGGAGGVSGGGGSAGNASTSRAGKKSAGCGKQPVGATQNGFTNHRIAIAACAACTVPNCPRDCIAPPFVPGGVNAGTAPNGETFIDRDYTIQLPFDYDPNHPYPVFFGADGCGPAPPLKGAGFSVPGEDGAIKVGLQQITPCFADGGIRCAPDIKNVGACLNGPEIPYFLAVQSWVEANFCVDLGTEFVGGGSSGAWEALLAGCAAADTVRGTYSLAGGLREHRSACNGPSAAFMIVSDADTANPVGPLAQLNVIEDTFGMAPARDEILKRNGCTGSEHVAYDAKYPACVKYSGCPAAYPVVWCEFAGGSHDNPNYNGVNYLNAVAPFLLGLPPAP